MSITNIFILTDEQIFNGCDLSAFQPSKISFTKKTTFLAKKRKEHENKILINNEDFPKVITIENKKEMNKYNTLKEEFDTLSSEATDNVEIVIPLDEPENENENNQLLNPILNQDIQKPQLFQVKTKIQAGRKPKLSMAVGKHTKYSHDNALRKIKVKFHNKIINYMNGKIISKYRTNIKTLKPLAGEISQNNTIAFNTTLLNSKLKDVLSTSEINGKFKNFDKFYNKNVIETIYKEDIKELIDILEMTYLEVFRIFRNLNDTEKLVGLEKYDSVIRELKLKGNNDEYIQKIEKIIMKFEKYYLNKVSRK